jgi:hypothetical protein
LFAEDQFVLCGLLAGKDLGTAASGNHIGQPSQPSRDSVVHTALALLCILAAKARLRVHLSTKLIGNILSSASGQVKTFNLTEVGAVLMTFDRDVLGRVN